MTELLRVKGNEKVLELGTGSGYQTAVLAKLARQVFSAELEAELARTVRARLDRLGITNVVLRVGDGVHIFRDEAPFDAILSAAAPLSVPEPLVDTIAEGGRCIIPVGGGGKQHLWVIDRKDQRVTRTQLDAVRFVPLR